MGRRFPAVASGDDRSQKPRNERWDAAATWCARTASRPLASPQADNEGIRDTLAPVLSSY
ncbi:hypothetical protein E2C01_096392 [Portunus trituberculatus]|uniref:Uncharacterized protein n=1 Tax=Portunus trituberculatus TaxID=210409 RepID=A0A5B7K2V9_PORTR|nr:hypothetical protein [Portunus trituberculatus]